MCIRDSLQRGVVIIHMRLVRDEPAENIVAVMRQCGERQERRKVDAERNGDEQQAAPEAELYGFIKEHFLHGGVAFLFAVRDDEPVSYTHLGWAGLPVPARHSGAALPWGHRKRLAPG